METMTVQAVYKKGVLKPVKKLNLPENSLVVVRVTPARKAKKDLPFASLIGVWEYLPEVEKTALGKSVRAARKRSASKVKRIAKRLK
ncbi:MAG: DUF104 domain-containing protein [Chloroflexi bacterium CFX1]|nr:DUF104 domain-containing protein [Chloroflexi bacterium CFX1]MCQ3954759.1 hypothetical protein [Chloroflexota bacterium]MDL1919207.1 DUF104 domain-containing protein [Chloroflexi bacterium CFX5]NUQ59259.1 antitoxin family protein [Anaerolineales bacterium]